MCLCSDDVHMLNALRDVSACATTAPASSSLLPVYFVLGLILVCFEFAIATTCILRELYRTISKSEILEYYSITAIAPPLTATSYLSIFLTTTSRHFLSPIFSRLHLYILKTMHLLLPYSVPQAYK